MSSTKITSRIHCNLGCSLPWLLHKLCSTTLVVAKFERVKTFLDFSVVLDTILTSGGGIRHIDLAIAGHCIHVSKEQLKVRSRPQGTIIHSRQ
jgi:hypothetical protein